MRPNLADFVIKLPAEYTFKNVEKLADKLHEDGIIDNTEYEVISLLAKAMALANLREPTSNDNIQPAADTICNLISQMDLLSLERFVDILQQTDNKSIAQVVKTKIDDDKAINERLGLYRIYRTTTVDECDKESICSILREEKLSLRTVLNEKFTVTDLKNAFKDKYLQQVMAKMIIDMRQEESHLSVSSSFFIIF